MTCIHCTDPNGDPCYPEYGLAPHLHGTGSGSALGPHFVPRELWPPNFQEDPDNPNHGTWWCPHCGSGKPQESGSHSSNRCGVEVRAPLATRQIDWLQRAILETSATPRGTFKQYWTMKLLRSGTRCQLPRGFTRKGKRVVVG